MTMITVIFGLLTLCFAVLGIVFWYVAVARGGVFNWKQKARVLRLQHRFETIRLQVYDLLEQLPEREELKQIQETQLKEMENILRNFTPDFSEGSVYCQLQSEFKETRHAVLKLKWQV